LDTPARREAENHAAACSDCQDELAGLRVTLDALSTLREEELPRRIAFVSDKVFEPRWWQKLFLRPSFAAAGLIAAAILVHGFVRPVAGPAQVDTSAITAQVATEVNQRLQAEMVAAVSAAVARAVADTEKRDDQRTALLLAGTEQRYAEVAEYMNKRVTQMYALNTGAGVR
jgi:hypothetical protein